MPTQINTFVFFDLETTGLIQGDMFPDITELALVAVSRRYIAAKKGENPMHLPRVMHKLSIPVCPQQVITPRAAQLSKLSNASLRDARPFDQDTIRLIRQFLRRLPGIICFVAHNGNRFDYQIFLSELNHINEYFPVRLRCVDTLEAFMDHYNFSNYKLSTVHQYLIGKPVVNQHCAEDDCLNLLRCVRQIDTFALWADQQAVRLHEV